MTENEPKHGVRRVRDGSGLCTRCGTNYYEFYNRDYVGRYVWSAVDHDCMQNLAGEIKHLKTLISAITSSQSSLQSLQPSAPTVDVKSNEVGEVKIEPVQVLWQKYKVSAEYTTQIPKRPYNAREKQHFSESKIITLKPSDVNDGPWYPWNHAAVELNTKVIEFCCSEPEHFDDFVLDGEYELKFEYCAAPIKVNDHKSIPARLLDALQELSDVVDKE